MLKVSKVKQENRQKLAIVLLKVGYVMMNP
jgi:hypothetical protein